jgi:ATP-binding cassette, subfamily B, bacterial MsbA
MATRAPHPLVDQNSFQLLKRLWGEAVMPYRNRLILAAACMILVAGATALTAWMMDPVINELFVKQDRGMIWLIAAGVLVTFLVRSGATFAQEVLVVYVGQRIVADIQVRLFGHLLKQDVATLQGHNSGTLLSRFSYDVNLMRFAVSDAVVVIGRDLLSIIFLVGLMFYQDWLLATIAFAGAPLTIYPLQMLGKRVRSITRETQEEMGTLTSRLGQSFQGIRTVKAFRMEPHEQAHADTLIERIRSLSYRSAYAKAATQPIIDALGGVAIAAIIVYGGLQVIDGHTTAGAFFSFIAAMLMAYQPLRALGKLNARIQEGLAAAERVYALLDHAPSIVDPPNAQTIAREAGSVRLQDVRFSYNGETQALDGVTLEAPAGKTTALVGPSGAGKSSIFAMIPRFYDVQGGQVIVNGVNVCEASLGSLRDTVAVVSQEVVLFDDSVANNIRYGRWDATRAEVEAAAKAAAAHDFIQAMPAGYETMVGEQGMKLSGGQRQRIAIARAILKDAPILLLDEATSALDTESERQIQTALARLMQGRTTIVIAHRLSTVIDADVIHVMDGGKLVQSGKHGELLDQGGLYAHLHALQFSEAA